jgi:hypothetical protein
VDDILIVGNNDAEIQRVQQHFRNSFKRVTTQEEVKKFLGIQIEKINDSTGNYLLLHQSDYALQTSKGFTSGKPKRTPLPLDLTAAKEDKSPKVKPIHDLVGQLRFLADRCRGDLAFVASFLARFAASATQVQIDALNRSLQYLNLKHDLGLKVGSADFQLILRVFTDASFAKEFDSKAQLCYAFFLSDDSGTVLFKSWRDKAVSISTTQAEIHALVDALKAILWYRELLRELGFEQTAPTMVYQDNVNVVNLADYSSRDNQTKYLINKINFIREAIDLNVITIQHVGTADNIADIGTKSLDPHQHEYLNFKLMNGINS